MKEMGRVELYRNRNLGTKLYGCALAPLVMLVIIIQNQGRLGRERNGRQRGNFGTGILRPPSGNRSQLHTPKKETGDQ